tara:strand:- start:1599 stop:2612 length:1014 start_codon:yes stop_codon:yes gene_type:complete
MRAIQKWLFYMLCLVASIVVIGGITRLTGSGLSMVDWRPIMGILPPITSYQWFEVFSQYQQSPEYQQVNMGMSINEFKFIFYWEYIHRILGRIIGLAAIIPYIYFVIKKQCPSSLKKTWPFIILLIGAQGLMGWYMVKSGLVNNPNVSHLRLASHLGLAFTIFALILWQYLTIRFDFKKQSSPPFQPLLYGVSVAIVIQIMYGAFTAGLNAGYYFNTYPKMGPFWVPPSIFMFDGFINNLLNNPILVQWVHRWLAALVIIGVISIWQGCKKRTGNFPLQISGLCLFGVTGLQFILGILTLLTTVWLPLAIAHQFGGLMLITCMTLIHYFSRYTELGD